MKKILLLIAILMFFSFAWAATLNDYIVANADGYLSMHNNTSNFDALQKIPFMDFLLNRMGIGMMLQLTLSKDGLNAGVLNSIFGGDVEIVYKEKENFLCAFADSDITPKTFIEKFTPESTKILKAKGYSYIKNGKDYVVFFDSGVFSYMSGISPENYMSLLKTDGVFRGKLPYSSWISMQLELTPDKTKIPFNIENKDIVKKVNLKSTISLEDNKLIISMYTNTKLDPEIKKLIESSSNSKSWFSGAKYFGSGLYIIMSIDNINSIFDYVEQNAKSTDKKLIEDFRKYADYFTGRTYMFVPLSIGNLLSSDETENNYILSLEYNDSALINQLSENKSLSKYTLNGITYYETTSKGTKTYIYIDNNYLDISSIKPDSFIKMVNTSRTPITVKSYNILKNYIKNSVISFYWDIGEDLEKSMYLKAPFNESGAAVNVDYRNGELQLSVVIH